MIKFKSNLFAITGLTMMLLSITSCSSEPIVGTWVKNSDSFNAYAAPDEITISSTIFGKLYYNYQGTKVKLNQKVENESNYKYYFSYAKKYSISLNPRYKACSLSVEYNTENQTFMLKSYSISNWNSEYDYANNISLNDNIAYEKK